MNTGMTMTSARPPAKRGRPPAGTCQLAMVRLREPLRQLLDEWRSQQIDRPSRPEAVRRLAAQALAAVDEKTL
jgi:hypothetical protein